MTSVFALLLELHSIQISELISSRSVAGCYRYNEDSFGHMYEDKGEFYLLLSPIGVQRVKMSDG